MTDSSSDSKHIFMPWPPTGTAAREVSACAPSTVEAGTTEVFTLTGTGFKAGIAVTFAQRSNNEHVVHASNVEFVDERTLKATARLTDPVEYDVYAGTKNDYAKGDNLVTATT